VRPRPATARIMTVGVGASCVTAVASYGWVSDPM
jgi:hypothetical protein